MHTTMSTRISVPRWVRPRLRRDYYWAPPPCKDTGGSGIEGNACFNERIRYLTSNRNAIRRFWNGSTAIISVANYPKE